MHLEAIIDWTWRCSWRIQSIKLRNTLWRSLWCYFRIVLEGQDQVSLEIYCKALMEWVWAWMWRPIWSHIGDSFRGYDSVNMEVYLEAVHWKWKMAGILIMCATYRKWTTLQSAKNYVKWWLQSERQLILDEQCTQIELIIEVSQVGQDDLISLIALLVELWTTECRMEKGNQIDISGRETSE